MEQYILSAQNISKNYGSTVALAGVGLNIRYGESVAIMGTSGSGKTTLLHVLAGIINPDAGNVIFQSPAGPLDITSMTEDDRSKLRRSSFGFVFQQGLLLDELTAVENVSLALMLNGMSKEEATGYSTQWLTSLGLAGMENRRIGQLSGGQAQRVAIARAQVTGASVIFADEPTGALDSRTSHEVMDALTQSVASQHRTLVVVTHDAEVASRCHRIIRLSDGQIVEDSQPTTVGEKF